MSEGATTWALVVGIDEYDEPTVPRLKGAATDAVEVVKWLRKLGVPDAQILLHARPTAATRPGLDALGLPWIDDAREPAIWGSVARLLRVPDGTRLFVFLSGHGLWEPSSGRCFLTQEAGVNGVYPNLGLELYINCFLSSVFARQFLVMDGCLNLPYTPLERQKIAATIYSRVPYTARSENWLVECYGASLGEKAYEIDGRGAFLRRLLPAMDPDQPALDGTSLDFTSGARTIDMQKVMNPRVIEQVKRDAAAQVPTKLQTPKVQVSGNISARDPSPVFDLVAPQSVKLEIAVEPAAAALDVEEVRISVAQRPWWSMTAPLLAGDQINWPISVALPANLPVSAVCQVRSNAPWDAERAQLEFNGRADQAQVFRFAPRAIGGAGGGGGGGGGAGGGGGGGPAVGAGPAVGIPPAAESPTYEQYSVKAVWQGGAPAGILSDEYEGIERTLGISLPEVTTLPSHGDASPWLQVSPGIEIQRHETGPEFRVQANSLLRGRKLAADWATAISRVIPDDFGVMTVLRGDEAPEYRPNIRLVMPTAGARALAGPLAGHPTVSIGPPCVPKEPIWRSREGQSLAAIEATPSLRVQAGPTEIRIDLPWGSWSKVVSAPDVGPAKVVRLPSKIGTPPLRVALDRPPPSDAQYRIYGTRGTVPTGRISAYGDARGVPMRKTSSGKAGWALAAPKSVALERGTAVIRLGKPAMALFPILDGRQLAVEWSRRGLRVEPLSWVDSAEWDLLVATGRLDAISVEDAEKLTNEKWFDALLGLAGGYAVYALARWDYLLTVTGNLRRVEPTGVDVDLLAIATRRGLSGAISPEDRQLLAALSARPTPQIPLFRWGVTLARDLLSDVALGGSPWDVQLARIEGALSPISAWTAWTETG